MGLARLLSDIRTVARLEKLTVKVDRLAAASLAVSGDRAVVQSPVASRQGEIRHAVSAVMHEAGAALSVGEVHALVEKQLGRPVVRTSVLSQLWGHAEGRGRDEFVLVSKGVYRLEDGIET